MGVRQVTHVIPVARRAQVLRVCVDGICGLDVTSIDCSFSRPAVRVILVVAGVTVSLSVRNCPSIICLSVFLMSGPNGECVHLFQQSP